MRTKIGICSLIVCLAAAPLLAFLEDLCLPRRTAKGKTLMWCVTPNCANPKQDPNAACPAQTADFVTIMQGRSMIHMDSTYFIAQALGYRADVAYWIAAYNENTDYSQYVPIDQCGKQAANKVTIANGMTQQKVENTGRDYITAYFDGFQRTNKNTDGPLDHYVVSFSPNGTGTDVHGPQGVSGLYPLHYPKPGYPLHIDHAYQKTLANLRQWGMMRSSEPGFLCAAGLTDGANCLSDKVMIEGTVPFFLKVGVGSFDIDVPAGRKMLNYGDGTNIDYYEKLQSYLDDKSKTTGTLWKSPSPEPVPVQLARIGLYLHVLQDSSSHATYCGDDPPSVPGGCDPGTYMYRGSDGTIRLSFGNGCSNRPHIAGHVQETGTGNNPLPLRDYVALNNTVDELILFGNEVAKHQPGWIINPELLPPDLAARNAQGQTATDIKHALVGTIVKGEEYSGTEVYKSGVVTLPLQQPDSFDRLHAMNAALAQYSETLRKQSPDAARFVALENMPGNSADPKDTSVCWQAVAGGR